MPHFAQNLQMASADRMLSSDRLMSSQGLGDEDEFANAIENFSANDEDDDSSMNELGQDLLR